MQAFLLQIRNFEVQTLGANHTTIHGFVAKKLGIEPGPLFNIKTDHVDSIVCLGYPYNS